MASVMRQRRVARQLVELHRLERVGEPPQLNEVHLSALVRSVCKDYPAVELTAATTVPSVLSDSRHLAGVLFALLENAHLHGAPPVRVRVEPFCVIVSDCGPGFREDLIGRATARFVTGSPSKGVGLGLALAAAHAKLIGARLAIANRQGAGAELTIALPPQTLCATGRQPQG
jgi:signal transduction histidine kinase